MPRRTRKTDEIIDLAVPARSIADPASWFNVPWLNQDNTVVATELRDSESLQFLDTPIGARKAFSNAAAHGLAVTELKPGDPKAVEEIMALYRYVFDIAKISSRNQKKRA
jgi:hypothetical protein